MGVQLEQILDFCEELLNSNSFKDYSYNGLQVKGKTDIKKIVTGVTANIALFNKAKIVGADLVLTHHGLYWKGGDPRLVGVLGERVKELGGMSLIAYHLPLDAHPIIGNNALLVSSLGGIQDGFIKDSEIPNIAAKGYFEKPITVGILSDMLSNLLGRNILIVGPKNRLVEKFVVCSGSGGSFLEESMEGNNVLITGEIHEQHVHLANERGITTFVCGHHATECCGIMALGRCLAEKFSIEHEFININSPI
ncbi:MAG: Nif3-like dinuclear metal center hexameric protein [Succinivibrionaceae bacterium]